MEMKEEEEEERFGVEGEEINAELESKERVEGEEEEGGGRGGGGEEERKEGMG